VFFNLLGPLHHAVSEPVNPEKVDCFQCRHFFITWDKNFPRGCHALGFKSREMPSQMVFQASGMQCMKFEKKETPDP
jgi:hypothetical protein